MPGVGVLLPWLSAVMLVLWSRILPSLCVEPVKPAVFVLGDSLVDPGNNNYILSLAKSNYPPNGLDFPQGATGRFCNGRTSVDHLVEMIGLPFTPAYLDPKTKGPAILQGVNYASGAGGILDSSGYSFIGRIGLNKQLDYATNTRAEFVQQVGESKTAEIYAKSLWFIIIGSNDYVTNYFVLGSPVSKQYTLPQYQDLLISNFEKQLRRLYSIGARKIVVYGVGPLGCLPSQLALRNSPDGKCIEFINVAVRGFNAATKALLPTLTASLPGATFAFGNSYDLVASIVSDPAKYGFTLANTGCCGVGNYNGALPCIPPFKPCPNRDLYFFWDAFHPTDRGNGLLASAFFSGGPDVIEPFNIQQLASM